MSTRFRSDLNRSSRRPSTAAFTRTQKRTLRLESLEKRLTLAAQLDPTIELDSPNTELVAWNGDVVENHRGEWLVQFARDSEQSPSQLFARGNSDSNADTPAAQTLSDPWLAKRRPLKKLVQTDATETWLYHFEDALIQTTMLRSLQQASGVLLIEPNAIISVDLVPDDPSFGSLWGLDNEDDADIDAPEAWERATGSDDVVVAVI